jgi:hypothetical protein
MQIRSLWVKPKRKERQSEREETTAEISHRLTIENHPNPANDEQQANKHSQCAAW